jgi:hypothetical protein
MRRYLGPNGGYIRNVLRILSAGALIVLVAAACGSSARHSRSATPGLPPDLAQAWAAQASAVADASAAGDSCHASQLASSLRDDVITAQARVPTRLRSPLLAGVNALADRITCVPKPPPPPPGHKKPSKPGHDHHDHHHGDGGDQGSRK